MIIFHLGESFDYFFGLRNRALEKADKRVNRNLVMKWGFYFEINLHFIIKYILFM